MKNYFAGTWKLTKFKLRKERLSSAIWILVIVGLSVAVTVAFAEVSQGEQRKKVFIFNLSVPPCVK